MKLKSLRYDKYVKPSWRKGMNIAWNIVMVMLVARVFVSMWSRYNKGGEAIVDAMNWIVLIGVVLFIVPGVVYLIKPGLFKMNKEQ